MKFEIDVTGKFPKLIWVEFLETKYFLDEMDYGERLGLKFRIENWLGERQHEPEFQFLLDNFELEV